MTKPKAVLVALAGVALTACSATRPTLYPNDQYNRAGSAQADRDIAACEQQAQEYVKTGGQGTQMAGEAARNAGVGAAVGAASGATAGLLGTMFGWMFQRKEPDPVYRNFVEKCLRDKGYEPIGWQ